MAKQMLSYAAESRQVESVEDRLAHLGAIQNLGKRPRTAQFNDQILSVIKKHFPCLSKPAKEVTEQDVLTFAQRVNEYCPSRWNAMLSVLRCVTDKAAILKRRKLRFRDFTPPSQAEFTKLLAECDALPRSEAGGVVRFLTLTGVRFCEARKLRWENIGADRVNITSDVSKNGKPRSIPFLPGMRPVIEGLRNESDYVIPKPNIRRAIEKACKRAGLQPLSYHCFRHIFITKCIEGGVDLPTVARWCGHSDGGALLARMYFHLLPAHSFAMAQKVTIL